MVTSDKTAVMIGHGIQAILCLIVVTILAPLSVHLRDEGAPDWLCIGMFAVAGVSFLGMLVAMYRVIRAGR